MVRFEDIAASPHKMTEELYHFVGLAMVDKIAKWNPGKHCIAKKEIRQF